jgi:arylsulfatase A-like enzyme
MQSSIYKPNPVPRRLPADAPNILIIMLDDVGFGLPSTYGGDINTPTLSRIANSGVSYNRFHTAAMCSPTRAALLTGRNHHRVGNGQISELANDWPGYTGTIPRSAATVAKVLGYYGYSTSAFGKWHNTPATETTAVGPYMNWPVGPGIGFDYFYGFLAGESSQYEPAVVENTVRLAPAHGVKKLSLHGGHGRQGGVVDQAAARADAGPALPDVLVARCRARSASDLQGVGRQVQRQVRPGLGRHARAHLRAPERAWLDSRQFGEHAAARHAASVEGYPRG